MFELTPWYLRLFGYKKYRRMEWYDVFIYRGVGQKWKYYSENEVRKINEK